MLAPVTSPTEMMRRHWPTATYCLLAALLVTWIGWDAATHRLITFSSGADYWEHAGALRALIEHPLEPGNPHLNSPEASPRYTPLYWLIAVVCKALGVGVLGAMGGAACFNVGLFLVGVHWFFRLYFRSQLAPLVAFVVLFFSWWNGWHYSNVYQLQMLPSVASYPSTAALGLTWFAFGLATRAVRAKASTFVLLALGTLCWLVLLVHPLTAAMTFTGVGFLVLSEPGIDLRKRWPVMGTAVFGAVLTHWWPFYSPFEVLLGGSGGNAGWMTRAAGQAVEGGAKLKLHKFYNFRSLLHAFGLALPGLYFAACLAQRRKHLFVPLGLVVMLGVFAANSVVRIPLGHRFVLLAMVFVHIALVSGCLSIFSNAHPPNHSEAPRALERLRRWVPVVAIGALALLGVSHNWSLARNRAHRVKGKHKTSLVLRRAIAVGEQTTSSSVVLANRRDAWSIPAFGPKVVSLLHANPLVVDGRQRRSDTKRFFSAKASSSLRKSILLKYGVTHVLLQRRKSKKVQAFLAGRSSVKKLPGGYRLFTLNPTGDKGPVATALLEER